MKVHIENYGFLEVKSYDYVEGEEWEYEDTDGDYSAYSNGRETVAIQLEEVYY